jgi:hypothetical protein
VLVALLVQTPLFLLFGVGMAFAFGNKMDTFFTGPLLLGTTIQLLYGIAAYYMDSISTMLAEYKTWIFVLPLGFNTLWFLMTVYGVERRLSLVRVFCVSYYFCYWPIAWLIPIGVVYNVNTFYFIYAFVGVGVLVFAAYGIYKLAIELKDRMDFKAKHG